MKFVDCAGYVTAVSRLSIGQWTGQPLVTRPLPLPGQATRQEFMIQKKRFAWPATHSPHPPSTTTMSSFFTIPNSAKKRKRTGPPVAGDKPKKAREAYLQTNKKRQLEDEDISSESGGESDGDKARAAHDEDGDQDEEFEGETAAEKRLRLAQQYLDNLREDAGKAWHR